MNGTRNSQKSGFAEKNPDFIGAVGLLVIFAD